MSYDSRNPLGQRPPPPPPRNDDHAAAEGRVAGLIAIVAVLGIGVAIFYAVFWS